MRAQMAGTGLWIDSTALTEQETAARVLTDVWGRGRLDGYDSRQSAERDDGRR
jgi:hypothetical protein